MRYSVILHCLEGLTEACSRLIFMFFQGGSGHFGTYQSIIHGVASAREGNLKKLRTQLFPKPMPKFGPKLPRRLVIQLSSDLVLCIHAYFKNLFAS